MSKAQYSDDTQAQSAWVFACQKAGFNNAAQVRPGGTVNQLHEQRKEVRRAMNAIRANGADDDQTVYALHHAGNLVAKINSLLDGLDRVTERNQVQAGEIQMLRNANDFHNHFDRKRDDATGEGDMTITDFLRGVANMRTTTAVHNALSVGTDAAGGYAVPSVLMPGIMSALVPASSLLQAGSGIVMLEEGAKNYTFAVVNTIPTAAWRNEGASVATSDPAFRAVVATPRSLAFTFKVSRELLADARGLQDALFVAIAQAFAKELDRAGLRGSGSGSGPEPRGLLNVSGIQSVTNGTNGASQATTKFANLFSGVTALLAADAPMPTAAIMSPRSLVGFGQLADTTGQPLAVPSLLSGIKQIATSQIPNNLTVGTSNDCTEVYLGDFSNAFFAMRESVSIQLLNELYASTGEIGFVAHVRADFVVSYPAAFAVVTGMRA